jgi:NADH dehydrogenase
MTHATSLGVDVDEVHTRDFPDQGFDVVTGAFSYSGAAIARELERSGRQVRTLTGHQGRADPDTAVDVRPLDFDDVVGLSSSLEGATTLYNTYWVRFPHGRDDFERAVANSRTLFHAARQAGVERIVHVSITHPSISSPYGYFRGKAHVERALAEVGVPYAVLRPGILFGGDGVLINNIAWLLRHLPVFGVGGKGDYRIRPVHIDDLAALAVAASAERNDTVVDAVGPERPAFLELVTLIREAVGSRALIMRLPGFAVPALASVLGLLLRDVLLTGDEFRAMSEGLADTDGPATGTIAVSDWIRHHADTLGRSYANEIERHFH